MNHKIKTIIRNPKLAYYIFARNLLLSLHHIKSGDYYRYGPVTVRVPKSANKEILNALRKMQYEIPERLLIERYLQKNQNVIELGGCYGVVSALIRSHIGPDACHVIVEGNPDLIDICTENATIGSAPGATTVINAVAGAHGETAAFYINQNAHVSSKASIGDGDTKLIPTVRLKRLHDLIGSGCYSLVCDIEGAELDLFEQEGEVLKSATVAIVEIHPDFLRRVSEDSFFSLIRSLGFKEAERVGNVVALVR